MSATGDHDPDESQSAPIAVDTGTESSPTRPVGTIQTGVVLVLVGHVVACGLAVMVGPDNELGWVLWFMFLGITQLAHVLPLALWAWVRGRHRTLKGIWIGAGITALLNAACTGIALAPR